MFLKYDVNDIVILKKKADVFEEHEELHKHDRFRIIQIDEDDDELPYLIEYYIAGRYYDHWLRPKEVKKLASVTYVGGE